MLVTLLWPLSRLPALRKAGAAGPGEPRTLIDAMSAAAPGQTPALLAVRPWKGYGNVAVAPGSTARASYDFGRIAVRLCRPPGIHVQRVVPG